MPVVFSAGRLRLLGLARSGSRGQGDCRLHSKLVWHGGRKASARAKEIHVTVLRTQLPTPIARVGPPERGAARPMRYADRGVAAKVDVAVIGAGPYGLSTAAYLRERGLDVAVFGK